MPCSAKIRSVLRCRENYNYANYPCGCCVDLGSHARDFPSRTDCAAAAGRHRKRRWRNEGVVGRLLARPCGPRALPPLLVRRWWSRPLQVISPVRRESSPGIFFDSCAPFDARGATPLFGASIFGFYVKKRRAEVSLENPTLASVNASSCSFKICN